MWKCHALFHDYRGCVVLRLPLGRTKVARDLHIRRNACITVLARLACMHCITRRFVLFMFVISVSRT